MAHKSSAAKKIMFAFSLQALLITLIFAFGNCSKVSEHQGSDNIQSLKFGNCSLQDSRMLFAFTYSPLLQTKCAGCHVEGKEGKGAFGSSNLDTAYSAFEAIGYKRISSYAVDSNHNSPFTGPDNLEAIKANRELWLLGQAEIQKCTGSSVKEFVNDPWINTRTYSKSKAVNPDPTSNVPVKVQWTLDSDMVVDTTKFNWPSLPGAVFEVEVSVGSIGGMPTYTLLRPKIIYPTTNAQAVDVHLESIKFKLNGQDIINETTFHYVSADARKNSTTYLSAGGMIVQGELRESDVLSFSMGSAETIVMAPPPPGISAQFSLASTTVTEGAGGQWTDVDVRLQLSQSVDQFTVLNISLDNAPTLSGRNAAKRPCCQNLVNADGMTVMIKNFDRDYLVEGYYFETPGVQFQLQLLPNTTEKNFTIRVFDDDRFEGEEFIKLDLLTVDVGNELGNVGTINSHTLVIRDNGETAPVAGETTFTQLMSPGGVLNKYCIKCHYSNSREQLFREYDLAAYTNFFTPKELVKKGDPANSLVYGRIMGRFPVTASGSAIDPMPQGSPLPIEDKNKVYNWIYYGAKNN